MTITDCPSIGERWPECEAEDWLYVPSPTDTGCLLQILSLRSRRKQHI